MSELSDAVERLNREYETELEKARRNHKYHKYGSPEFAAAAEATADTCKTLEWIHKTPGVPIDD